MKLQVGRKFWIAATVGFMAFTGLVVGRNLLHVLQIRKQIGLLRSEQQRYRARIEQDSTLIEHLRYDDYLEEYAREHFHMLRPGDRVYVIE